MANLPAYLKPLFPATKLRPPGTQDTIQRTLLIDQLRRLVLTHRVTLISAPAGSGKTTLAADFARSTESGMVRWLSLNDGDNDLKVFLLAVVLAVLPDADDEWSYMVSQGTIPARQVANTLINRLDEDASQPFVLVLDDLHLLTDADIHQFLDYLVEHLPAHAHVVITTRYDPPIALSKLRARGELAELRLDALRFNHAEVNELLNRVLNLNISEALVNQMVERTEGWIAGLRLLALSLGGIDVGKRAQYIEDLARNDRYVFELLAEEVLRQQQEDIRKFLLETSILDELTPEQCAAVTQQPDAADKLAYLHRHNLFLVSIGDGSYRYHALFRDFLLEQLRRQQPDHLKELHRRAAQVQADPIQQLEHLISAERWDEVSDKVQQILMPGIHSIWSNTDNLRWETFLSRIPEALRQNDPWLLVARATVTFKRGIYTTSVPLLETAYHLFRERGDAEGEFLSKLYLLLPQVQQASSADVFQQFYDHVTTFVPIVPPQLHAFLLQGGLWNSSTSYRHEQVEYFLTHLIDELIQDHDQGVFPSFSQSIGDTLFFTSQGAAPFERVLPYMKRYATGEQSLIRMGVDNIESFLALFRGDLDTAWAAAQHAREIAHYYDGFAWAENVIDSVLLSVMLIREDYARFDRYYNECTARITMQDTGRYLMAEYQYRLVQRLLNDDTYAGQAEAAQAVIEQMTANLVMKEHEVLMIIARGNLARQQGELDDALDWMKQATELQTPLRRFYPAYALLSLALVYWLRKEQALALKTLQEALRPLAEWGYPGIVLLEGRAIMPLLQAAAERGIYPEMCRFCFDILSQNRETRTVEIPGSTDSFTPREVEILRLTVNGASNRDIAEALVISENTVKSHISHILSKLGAKSRTEAAARVRYLGITL